MGAMPSGYESFVSQGREKFLRGDGRGSRRSFEAALAEGRTPEALEGVARALFLEGDYLRSMEMHEAAYRAHRQCKDLLGAARAARVLAWIHGNLHGDWALGSGWLSRARSLLAEVPEDTAEAGWLNATNSIFESDPIAREAGFRRALDLARRFDDPDLEFEATSWLGWDLVHSGKTAQGKALLDESLAAVCAGEVGDLYVVEGVFCAMFGVCEKTCDIPRVEQWLRAAARMETTRSFVALGAFCRAHYGGILTAAGKWPEAEAELLEAARIFEKSYEGMRAHALVRLADLRVRQGRLEEASALLLGMEEHPDAARPLAALRLARGEVSWARDLLDRRLASTAEDGLASAPLLALLVDVSIADGDLGAAAIAAERLLQVSVRHTDAHIRGLAALGRGKVCREAGRTEAREWFQGAMTAFSEARMPADYARAQLELARLLVEVQPDVAKAEAHAAMSSFEDLQAARDADGAAQFLRSLGASGRKAARTKSPLTKRESEVLDLLGSGLTNQEIADRLFISPKTVEHHVGSILSKLLLRNRAEAAAYSTRAR